MKKEQFLGRKGQSLVEILIGLTLIVLGIGAAAILVFGGGKLLVDRQNAVQARNFASEGLEVVRVIRDRSWNELTDGEHGLLFQNGEWTLSGSSTTDGLLTRKIIITTESENVKKVESEVVWQTDPQRVQEVSLVTLVTNWENVSPPSDPGDSGGGGISGDWQNPRTLGSLDLGPGNSATDLDVIDKIVYMSAEASASNKPDFWIIDATDGENPTIVSSLDTGPSLNSIDATVNYAYLANRSEESQLQVIDIANINNPTLLTSYQLPDVSGSGAVGQSIFYSDSKVYIGTKAADGPEFHIVDVSSPATPSSLGSFEVGADINDIVVLGGKAYLATSQSSEELKILDITGPSSITQVGSWDTEGGPAGRSVYVLGAKAYLGQDSWGDKEFYALDVTDPVSVELFDKEDFGGSVNDIVVRDDLAFLAGSNSNQEFQIWNISDPNDIQFWSSFNFPQIATGIDYEDNLVYVSVRSNDALRIITSSP